MTFYNSVNFSAQGMYITLSRLTDKTQCMQSIVLTYYSITADLSADLTHFYLTDCPQFLIQCEILYRCLHPSTLTYTVHVKPTLSLCTHISMFYVLKIQLLTHNNHQIPCQNRTAFNTHRCRQLHVRTNIYLHPYLTPLITSPFIQIHPCIHCLHPHIHIKNQ